MLRLGSSNLKYVIKENKHCYCRDQRSHDYPVELQALLWLCKTCIEMLHFLIIRLEMITRKLSCKYDVYKSFVCNFAMKLGFPFLSYHKVLASSCKTGPEVTKKNVMFNSGEHEFSHADKFKNANNCWHFYIYELEK